MWIFVCVWDSMKSCKQRTQSWFLFVASHVSAQVLKMHAIQSCHIKYISHKTANIETLLHTTKCIHIHNKFKEERSILLCLRQIVYSHFPPFSFGRYFFTFNTRIEIFLLFFFYSSLWRSHSFHTYMNQSKSINCAWKNPVWHLSTLAKMNWQSFNNVCRSEEKRGKMKWNQNVTKFGPSSVRKFLSHLAKSITLLKQFPFSTQAIVHRLATIFLHWTLFRFLGQHLNAKIKWNWYH